MDILYSCEIAKFHLGAMVHGFHYLTHMKMNDSISLIS